MTYRERHSRSRTMPVRLEMHEDRKVVVLNEEQSQEYRDVLERYRMFEEDEFLLQDAPHVGEDDDN